MVHKNWVSQQTVYPAVFISGKCCCIPCSSWLNLFWHIHEMFPLSCIMSLFFRLFWLLAMSNTTNFTLYFQEHLALIYETFNFWYEFQGVCQKSFVMWKSWLYVSFCQNHRTSFFSIAKCCILITLSAYTQSPMETEKLKQNKKLLLFKAMTV